MNRFWCVLSWLPMLVACGPSSTPAPTAQSADWPTPPRAADPAFVAKLDAVLAGSWRAEANRTRDRFRHPKETLLFFGLAPGMNLIELTPGAGWYAEILAPLQKGSGGYVAAVAVPQRAESEAAKAAETLRKKFAADPERYGEARIIEFDLHAPVLGPPNSADMVVTFRNVHNWEAAGATEAMFKACFDVLKPGGVLGLTDHRAAPGARLAEVARSGYIPEDYVIRMAEQAGFRLQARSEINANPKDTKDHPQGVWTLPPTLALGDRDRARYLAIGESDRMTLRFVKPATDRIFAAPDPTTRP
jgi:predicted methyltransferase